MIFPINIVHKENRVTDISKEDEERAIRLQLIINDVFNKSCYVELMRTANNSLDKDESKKNLDEIEQIIFNELVSNREYFRKVLGPVTSELIVFSDYRKIIRIVLTNTIISSELLNIK